MRFLALDISTSTGLCWSDKNAFETAVEGKQKGDTNAAYSINLYNRVVSICNQKRVQLALIENYSFGSLGKGKTVLAELGGVVKLALQQSGVPFILVAPPSWKLCILGNGHIAKVDIKLKVYKAFKVDFSDKAQDECDAFALWKLGGLLEGEIPTKLKSNKAFLESRKKLQEVVENERKNKRLKSV